MVRGLPAPIISTMHGDSKYTGQVKFWCNVDEQTMFSLHVRQKQFTDLHFYAVTRTVEVPRYKPECRGFDSGWGHWEL